MINKHSFTRVKFLISAIALAWQTSVVANTTEHFPVSLKNQVKLIQIEIVELTDNSGLTYIGGKVSAADLAPYLAQMKQIVGDDFALYRQNQNTRDHSTFHITLINPYEYQLLKEKVELGALLSVSLQGLGRVIVEDKVTYFVVAQSSQADIFRQKWVLTRKDFHVTLGFNPDDIYGVSKGVESLIK